MEINPSYKLWLGIGGLSLIALTGVVLLLKAPPEITTEPPTTPANHRIANPTTVTVDGTLEVVDPVVLVIPQVPAVDFPQGSIGRTCAVNDFPPYHWYFDLDYETIRSLDNPYYDSNGDERVLKGECHSVLERHMYSINPYYWGAQDEKRPVNRAFDFIVIDNPLTFERIFADPAGDFARVQEAFTHPECRLSYNAESNWELNESCHADAILNYALITRFCYNDAYQNGYKNWVSERNHRYYLEEDKPTPAQDRHMWIQNLEDRWMKRKCETLDSNLNLHSKQHAELRHQIQALQPELYNRVNLSTLIGLAARLGDDAAALTQPAMHVAYRPSRHSDKGYQYGPFAGWFTNKYKLFAIKEPPSVDRISQALSLFAKNIVGKKGRRVIIDHEALVQHLCTPPYYDPDNEYPNPPSCRTVVNELRQEALHHTTLNLIATFEDVAMRLDVYE